MADDFKLHIPVLLQEVLDALKIRDNGVYVDATFGAGGYTGAILKQARTKVIGIDRDPLAFNFANLLKEQYKDRFTFYNICFSQMAEAVKDKVDGIVFDLGVSSMQIDNPDRGFSFQKNGHLDMRMGQYGKTAADVVNAAGEQELADLIYNYGEEKFSRKIAKAIVTRRQIKSFISTLDLADLIAEIVPRAKDGIHPATRTFQALRICVNNELEELQKALTVAAHLLKPNGKLVVVTFHSLEDKIVKSFMQDKAGKLSSVNRYVPIAEKVIPHNFVIPYKKVIFPTEIEIKNNPRARSAKMRVLERKGPADE